MVELLRKPMPPRLVQALLIVLVAGIPAACPARATQSQCDRRMETSSPMFGATWTDTFVLYTQDYNWKTSGDISKVNMYYGEAEGCVKGVKAQYGADPANSQRLGLETKNLQTRSIQLKAGERIVRAEYKASPKCIEYLSLRTNQGRQLAVGKFDSPTPTAFAAPNSPSGYLGYINGHTAKPMTSPNVGKLMQLQFVWATTECGSSAEPAVSASISNFGGSSSGGSKKKKQKKQGGGLMAGLMGTKSSEADAADDSGSSDAAGQCAGNHLCSDGKCVTSSCMLAGMGNDISSMTCYGTNMRLNFLSSGVDVSPCSFLGCKLDMASCTSSGVLGVGGFCTGRVVAMGATAMLHPQGKQWVGYPCIEHRANNLGLRSSMLGELTSAEDMVAKSWKVCDCVKTTTIRNRLAIMMPNGTISTYIFGKGTSPGGKTQQQQQQPPTVAVPLMPVYDMGLKDVVTQWLAARAGEATLPTATIPTQLASDLKQLVPGFMTPSIMVANTSAALMTHPDWMIEVPVFVLTNQALAALKHFMPDLTSLPTLALAPNMTVAEASSLLELPERMLVSNITVDALPTLASKLGLPTFLKLHPSTSTSKLDSSSDAGPHIVPLNNMHIGNVVVQWATAVSRKNPALPVLTVASKEQLAKLQAKVPGLVTPSIVVATVSSPLLYKPEKPALPVFVLPTEATEEAMAVLPDITSLPTLLVLPEQANQTLPELHLTDFIAPNMRVLVDTLGPSIPALLKQVQEMTLPALNNTINGIADNPAFSSLMPWGALLSSMPTDMLAAGLGGGNSSAFDMGSINEVVASVKEALTTSGFKLPYLTMTDETLEKWGLRQIESFVTNVVTRAGTPREDHALIEESDGEEEYDAEVEQNEDEEVDQAEDRRSKNKRSQQQQQRKSSGGAKATAHKHNKVAEALNALREEELSDHGSSGSSKKAAAADKKKPTKSRKQLVGEQDQAADDAEMEDEDAAADEVAEVVQGDDAEVEMGHADDAEVVEGAKAEQRQQQQQSPQQQQQQQQQQKPAEPSAAKSFKAGQRPAPRNSAAKPAPSASPAATAPSSSSSKTVPKPDHGSKAAKPEGKEPSAKQAFSPAPGAAATVPPPASNSPAAAPAGVPVPTLGDKAKDKKAPAAPAAAPPAAAAPKQQPAPQAAAAPLVPFGTEDEDGAVVIDEAAAKRAFLSDEQWSSLSQEHKDKLLMLIGV